MSWCKIFEQLRKDIEEDRLFPATQRPTITSEITLPDGQTVDFDKLELEVITEEKRWRQEGKCPDCGELGEFINLQMTCSKHGVY